MNKLIDSAFHPLFKKDKRYVIVDFLFHCLVEQDLPMEKKLEKFIRYNLKYLLR